MTANDPQPRLAPRAVSKGLYDRVDEVAVGVVGCGEHSMTSIMPSLRHACIRLVAVCDLDPERAETAQRRFGAEAAYGSVDDMLARSKIDAVVVVGPPDLHVAAGIAALESGRHLFIEKPPANSLADADRLRRAGQIARRQVMVGFMKRYASAYRVVRQVMADDDFGPVRSVHVTYAHWPAPGLRNHLLDMSIHALDMVRWLLGDPVRVSVYKHSFDGNHVVGLMVEHRQGALSQLDLSAFQPGVQERLVVTGEQAVLQVEDLSRVVHIRQAADALVHAPNGRVSSFWTPEFAIPGAENDMLILQGYAGEMIAFADAVRDGHDVSPSIEDGVAALRLIEAVAAAPEGLSIVELPEAGVNGDAGI
jgi:predicted dehydrogenase